MRFPAAFNFIDFFFLEGLIREFRRNVQWQVRNERFEL